MAGITDTTTFVTLFHHEEKAKGAIKDLMAAGIPESAIYTLRNAADEAGNRATLSRLNVPERDLDHLVDGVADGGILIAVAFASDFTDRIEGIFQRNAAVKIDEAVVSGGELLTASDDPEKETDGTAGGFGTRVYRPIVEGTSLDDDKRRS